MKKHELIDFETRVARAFEAGEIRGPVHLSGGNEDALIRIFDEYVAPEDWVFCSYRNHYHALLHGIDPDWLMQEIRSGRSMYIAQPERRFMSSAIVAGCVPLAVGVAAAIKRNGSERKAYCFLGDMAATTGVFSEALRYADGHDLPIRFVIEDNGLSCDSPTVKTWGAWWGEGGGVDYEHGKIIRYYYKRVWPHVGTGKFVKFTGF